MFKINNSSRKFKGKHKKGLIIENNDYICILNNYDNDYKKEINIFSFIIIKSKVVIFSKKLYRNIQVFYKQDYKDSI